MLVCVWLTYVRIRWVGLFIVRLSWVAFGCFNVYPTKAPDPFRAPSYKLNKNLNVPYTHAEA
jgi:hypothetical protein